MKYKLDTGIEIKGFPGVVPEYHVISAAKSAHYEYYGNWQNLTREQQATLVGHYFSEFIVDSHKNEVVNDKAIRDQKKNQAKRGK